MKKSKQTTLPGIEPAKPPTRNKVITISVDAHTMDAIQTECSVKYNNLTTVATLASYAVMQHYAPRQ